MTSIIIIGTGGTIDANKYNDVSNPPEFAIINESSLLPELINFLGYDNLTNNLTYVDAGKSLKKDSKKFNDYDILKLFDLINEQPSDKIIITHGTDFMAENARKIFELMQANNCNKAVVFTGAYVPVANGLDVSDAVQNVKIAVEYLSKISTINSPNVVISMDGKIFEDITHVTKGKDANGNYKFFDDEANFKKFKNLFSKELFK